jgi:hypothetical protein
MSHGDVCPQHGDVDGDDSGEEECEEDHPDDVSADATLGGLPPRAYGRRRTRSGGPAPAWSGNRLRDLSLREPVHRRH